MKYLICFAFALFLSSCSTWKTQVTTMSSHIADDEVVYENVDVKLQYSFWSEGGKLDFTIENKTDEPIFIDWTHSNFIFNGFSYDFYSNDEMLGLRSVGVYNSRSGSDEFSFDLGVSVKSEVSSGIVTKDKTFSQIPPKSYIKAKIIGLSFPWVKIDDGKISYPENNTPLTVRNYLSYSMDKELSELSYVDNEFWVSSIEQTKGSGENLRHNDSQFYNERQFEEPKKTIILAGAIFGTFVGIFLIVAG